MRPGDGRRPGQLLPEIAGAELLPDVAALTALVERREISEAGRLTRDDLAVVLRLRDRLRAIFAATDEADSVRLVNDLVADARTTPRLTDHDGWPLHIHYYAPGARLAEHLAADCGMALAFVIAAGERSRLATCAAPDCDRVLVDLSRNRSKRYCDSRTCGNRLHVAAYRARQRTGYDRPGGARPPGEPARAGTAGTGAAHRPGLRLSRGWQRRRAHPAVEHRGVGRGSGWRRGSWSTCRRSTPVCRCSATTWRRRSCWPPPRRTRCSTRRASWRPCAAPPRPRPSSSCPPWPRSASRRSGAAAAGPWWFQVYVQRDRAFTRTSSRRAVDAGASALVLTVDLPVLGARDTDRRNSLGLPPGVEYANMRGLDPAPDPLPPERRVYNPHLDPTVTWDDLDWLASLVDVPVLVKGVLRPDDARRAVDHGARRSWCPTTAPGTWTRCPPRLRHCPGSSRRWAARCRCWSTAGCVAAPTWPRR